MHPRPRSPRPVNVATKQATHIGHRVATGLIAMSLAVLSLSLGLSLLLIPLPPSAFLGLNPTNQVTAASTTATSVTLTWTAPGDDGNTGTAQRYDVRYATSPLTEATFVAAASVAPAPPPQPAGATETLTVTGLQPATLYYFALESADPTGNVSPLSNVATVATAAVVDACHPTYGCTSWSACSNGQQTRTCTVTNGCISNLDEPVTRQSCIPAAVGGPITAHNHLLAIGAGQGAVPVVRLIDSITWRVKKEWLALDRQQRNGMSTAVGSFTGDSSVQVVVGSGPGSNPLIRFFSDQGKLLTQFNPYPTDRNIGVAVAAADIDGDGKAELLTVPATRGPAQVKIYRYNATAKSFVLLTQSFVFDRNQRTGFSIAAGQLGFDQQASFVVAPRGGSRYIGIFRLSSEKKITRIRVFAPFPRPFQTGMVTAIGDVRGNGLGTIIVAPGERYWSDVKLFDAQGKYLDHFLPTKTSYLGGISLMTFDVNKDGVDEILTGNYGRGDPVIRVFRYRPATHSVGRIGEHSVFPRSMQSGLRLSGD